MYLVKITIEDPYPKDFEERVEASSHGTAINRAVTKLRKTELKGRRIKTLRARSIKL